MSVDDGGLFPFPRVPDGAMVAALAATLAGTGHGLDDLHAVMLTDLARAVDLARDAAERGTAPPSALTAAVRAFREAFDATTLKAGEHDDHDDGTTAFLAAIGSGPVRDSA